MRRLFVSFIAISLFLVVCGCGGIKYHDIPINDMIPPIWKTSSMYPDTNYIHDVCEIVGAVLYEKVEVDPQTGNIKKKSYEFVDIIRPDNYKCTVLISPKADALRYYRSKVDNQANLQGSFLEYVTASFTVDQMAEVEIYDMGFAEIKWDQNIKDKIKEWVEKHPQKPSDVTRRVWVKNLVNCPWTYANYRTIDANASGVVGETVGAKGKVYQKLETQMRDAILRLDLFDIDRIVISLGSKKSDQATLEDSRYVTIIRGKLK